MRPPVGLPNNDYPGSGLGPVFLKTKRSSIAGRPLPSPLSAEDRASGYRHELVFRQAEIFGSRMVDRPVAGRVWFERALPDELTLGRPNQVAVVFGRRVSRRTPERFTPMTYDLRRLRRKGFIQRIPPRPPLPDHQRGTPTGRLSHQDLHANHQPLPAELDPSLPDDITDRVPLAKGWRAFERAL